MYNIMEKSYDREVQLRSRGEQDDSGLCIHSKNPGDNNIVNGEGMLVVRGIGNARSGQWNNVVRKPHLV